MNGPWRLPRRVILLAVLAAGCSAGSPPTATPVTTPAPTASPTNAPTATTLPSPPPTPTAASGPIGRGYHAIFDLGGSRWPGFGAGVLMLAGWNTSPPRGGHLLTDGWTFEGRGPWLAQRPSCEFELCIDGFPNAAGPMALDPESSTLILIEDQGGGTFTLDLAIASWRDQGVASPPAALGGAMAFDSESQRVMLFGGLDFGPPMTINNDTWSYDLASNQWTKMAPADPPPAGNYYAMVYDPVGDRMILFGGASIGDVPFGETWSYDYDDDTWKRLEPATSPPPRYYTAMTYDPVRRQMVLFGGTDRWASAAFEDTWVYDPASNTWTQLDIAGPGIRAWHAMAYDDDTDRVVLFGGGQTRETYQADTWLFDPEAQTWTEAGR